MKIKNRDFKRYSPAEKETSIKEYNGNIENKGLSFSGDAAEGNRAMRRARVGTIKRFKKKIEHKNRDPIK